MPKSPRAKSSEVLQDGARAQIPGLAGSSKIPLAIHQSAITNLFGGASAAISSWTAPCDCQVVGLMANIIAPPGTAAATLYAGIIGSTKSILNDYSVGTAHATGIKDFAGDAAFLSAGTFLKKGDVLQFGTNGNGTATGTAQLIAVIVPA